MAAIHRRRTLRSLFMPLVLSLPLSFGLLPQSAGAQTPASAPLPDNTIVMASTTSTEQSGLFDYLLPRLTAATGVDGQGRGPRHRPGAGSGAPRRRRHRRA